MAESAFQKFYPKLAKVLPMESLSTEFYSNGLLPGNHKAKIDALPTQKEKAGYFLDYVIKPGLEVGYIGQFDKMLTIMETRITWKERHLPEINLEALNIHFKHP